MTAVLLYLVGAAVCCVAVYVRSPAAGGADDWELGLAAVAWPLVALLLMLVGVGRLVRILLASPGGRRG